MDASGLSPGVAEGAYKRRPSTKQHRGGAKRALLCGEPYLKIRGEIYQQGHGVQKP